MLLVLTFTWQTQYLRSWNMIKCCCIITDSINRGDLPYQHRLHRALQCFMQKRIPRYITTNMEDSVYNIQYKIFYLCSCLACTTHGTWLCTLCSAHTFQAADDCYVLFALQDCVGSPSAVNLPQDGEPPSPLCHHSAIIPDSAWPPHGCEKAPGRECPVGGYLLWATLWREKFYEATPWAGADLSQDNSGSGLVELKLTYYLHSLHCLVQRWLYCNGRE